MISNCVSWLKFETDAKNQIWIEIDKSYKLNAYFLKYMRLDVQKL